MFIGSFTSEQTVVTSSLDRAGEGQVFLVAPMPFPVEAAQAVWDDEIDAEAIVRKWAI